MSVNEFHRSASGRVPKLDEADARACREHGGRVGLLDRALQAFRDERGLGGVAARRPVLVDERQPLRRGERREKAERTVRVIAAQPLQLAHQWGMALRERSERARDLDRRDFRVREVVPLQAGAPVVIGVAGVAQHLRGDDRLLRCQRRRHGGEQVAERGRLALGRRLQGLRRRQLVERGGDGGELRLWKVRHDGLPDGLLQCRQQAGRGVAPERCGDADAEPPIEGGDGDGWRSPALRSARAVHRLCRCRGLARADRRADQQPEMIARDAGLAGKEQNLRRVEIGELHVLQRILQRADVALELR